MVPSYLSTVGFFQVLDKEISMMASVNEYRWDVVPRVLTVGDLVLWWWESVISSILGTVCWLVLVRLWFPPYDIWIVWVLVSLCFMLEFSSLRSHIPSSFFLFMLFISSVFFFLSFSSFLLISVIIAIRSCGWFFVSLGVCLSFLIMFLVVTMWTLHKVFLWPHGGHKKCSYKVGFLHECSLHLLVFSHLVFQSIESSV